MPSFYNGKRFFLTYAQCEATKEDLLQFLEGKGDLRDYVIAREEHADGGHHLHACVEFVSLQRKQAAWLDFEGKHPNKQDPRKWDACKTYCKKDGDFVEAPKNLYANGSIGLEHATVCLSFDSEESWMSHCIEEKISYQYAQWFWQRMHGDASTIVTGDHEGKMCAALEKFTYNFEESKSLILRGPSGCGKTTWAKRNVPLPSLFCSHVDELKSFRTGFHKSIIFDDVDFNHWPRTSQIAIVDIENPRQVHCRHAIARIPAYIAKVFTCNADPVLLSDEAIRRRCRVINVVA